jgi:hypothetical protein
MNKGLIRGLVLMMAGATFGRQRYRANVTVNLPIPENHSNGQAACFGLSATQPRPISAGLLDAFRSALMTK